MSNGWLALTIDEQGVIHIGDDIRVKYCRPASNGRAVIAIQAPISVEVDRDVVRAAKLRERAAVGYAGPERTP